MMFTGLPSLYPTCTHFFRIRTSKRFLNQKKRLLSVTSVSYQATYGINLLPAHQSCTLTGEDLMLLPTGLEASSVNTQWIQDSFPPGSSQITALLIACIDMAITWCEDICFAFREKSSIKPWYLSSFVIGTSNMLTCNGPVVLLGFFLCSTSLNSSLLLKLDRKSVV